MHSADTGPVTELSMFSAGELVSGCGQVCITEETRAMATQLHNRLHRHGNRREPAFSRVTHLQVILVAQLCPFKLVHFFFYVSEFFLVSGSFYKIKGWFYRIMV